MSFALHKIKYFQLASATLIVAAMATGSFATEAPIKTERYTLNVETFASGLTSPWSVALLPDGLVLITEKPGNLRVMRDGKDIGVITYGLSSDLNSYSVAIARIAPDAAKPGTKLTVNQPDGTELAATAEQMPFYDKDKSIRTAKG